LRNYKQPFTPRTCMTKKQETLEQDTAPLQDLFGQAARHSPRATREKWSAGCASRCDDCVVCSTISANSRRVLAVHAFSFLFVSLSTHLLSSVSTAFPSNMPRRGDLMVAGDSRGRTENLAYCRSCQSRMAHVKDRMRLCSPDSCHNSHQQYPKPNKL
jgi:hypothetical protein